MLLKILILICSLEIIPRIGCSQFRDSISHSPLVPKTFSSDSVIGVDKRDSLPHLGDMALQFLAGEAAFNVTFFSLWGNDIFRQNGDALNPAVVGIFASWITTPLVIHYVSNLLHLKSGSWGFGILGAALGTLAGIGIFDRGNPTNTKIYLGLSLGIVTFAELFYDFTIWVSPSK